MAEQLHRAQVLILGALRHAEVARFSTLMRPTGLGSDVFKFHLKKLGKLGYVEKTESGAYRLTAAGKEFANNFDEVKRQVQRQPKLSILLIVKKPDDQSEAPRYLFQKRLRNPFFGFWSCIGGPVQWGEDIEETAVKELKKQTGLTAECMVRSFCRQYDYHADSDNLLEDKLFVIIEAMNVQGELSNSWYAGHNEWMTIESFKRQDKYFPSVCEAIEAIKEGGIYAKRRSLYSYRDY